MSHSDWLRPGRVNGMKTTMLWCCLLCSSCSLLAFDDLTFDREPVDGAGSIHDGGGGLEEDAAVIADDVGNDAGIVEPDAAFATPRARPVLVPRFPLSPCAGANPLTLRTWITPVVRTHLDQPGSCELPMLGPVIGEEQLVEGTEMAVLRPFNPETCTFYRQRLVGRSPVYVEEGVYTSATEGTATIEYHWSSGPGGQSCDDYFEVTFRDEAAE